MGDLDLIYSMGRGSLIVAAAIESQWHYVCRLQWQTGKNLVGH